MTPDLDNPSPGDPSGAPDPAPDPASSRCWQCGELPAPGQSGPPCSRCGAGAAPEKPRRGPGFFGGLAGVLRGLGFLNKNPGLWVWVLIPLIINAAIFGVIVWWALQEAGRFIPDMQTEWWAWIDWLRVSLSWILPKLMSVVVFLAAMITTLLLSSIINAPFYDLLSEKTEVTALGHPELERPWSRFVGDIAFSILAAIHLVLRQVVVMGILFALSFTAVGAPLFMLAGFFFSGFALIDMTLARKRYPAPERAAWGRRHIPHLIGLGIPINLLPPLAPLGVVAATLAYLDQPKKGAARGRV